VIDGRETMFDLEKSIRAWKRNLHRQETLEDGMIADLENHLRDIIEALKNEGIPKEEAFHKAVERVGGAESLASECGKVREYRLDRRSPWRPARFMPALLGNYLKLALRKIRRQKGYSFINIAGLAAGMACAILIFLWVDDELGFDRFHSKADKIYRVVTEQRNAGAFDQYAVTPRALGRTLKEEVPEIARASRFLSQPILFNDNGLAVSEYGAYVDADFLRMFSFPFLSGDPDSALNDPLSVVLTESLARKYFRGESPIGRTLKSMGGAGFRVTGVIRDVPPQSHLRFDFLLPFRRYEARLPQNIQQWGDTSYFTYVELGDRAASRPRSRRVSGLIKPTPQRRSTVSSRSSGSISIRPTNSTFPDTGISPRS